MIRTPAAAFHVEGGIAVLKGNIAHSGIIKQTAVDPGMRVHSGPAKVFYTEEDLMDAIGNNGITEGDVIVLPFQGPAGAPGMPEMLTPTDAIKGAGYKRVALLTDGRFSGATTGPSIGHIEMEAYNGGPIGAICDGDIIDIDIPKRTLNVRLGENEIAERLKTVRPPERGLTPPLDILPGTVFKSELLWKIGDGSKNAPAHLQKKRALTGPAFFSSGRFRDYPVLTSIFLTDASLVFRSLSFKTPFL